MKVSVMLIHFQRQINKLTKLLRWINWSLICSILGNLFIFILRSPCALNHVLCSPCLFPHSSFPSLILFFYIIVIELWIGFVTLFFFLVVCRFSTIYNFEWWFWFENFSWFAIVVSAQKIYIIFTEQSIANILSSSFYLP